MCNNVDYFLSRTERKKPLPAVAAMWGCGILKTMCVCVPIVVTAFPEWLSGTEPLPHTPGAVRPSCVCVPILVTTFPSGSVVRNHCRKDPAPCVRPRCVVSVLPAHAQFCRFDKADATADVQWHCSHRPQLWYHYFPAQSLLGADILSNGSEKSFGHVPPVGVEPSISCVQGEHPIH